MALTEHAQCKTEDGLSYGGILSLNSQVSDSLAHTLICINESSN
jgi:hypothetical protein